VVDRWIHRLFISFRRPIRRKCVPSYHIKTHRTMRHVEQAFQPETRLSTPLISLASGTARFISILALLFFVQAKVSGQTLTVYSSVTCNVSMKIYWSNTNCPGTPPYSSAFCYNINSTVSPVTIAPPPGYTKVGKVEFWCGVPQPCPNPSGPWLTWPGCGVGVPVQYLNCCGQNLDIQGSVEKKTFRIDQ